MKIKAVKAREILDSRGNPTISVSVILENGSSHESSVPSGASTGIHEARELRDGNNLRFGGLGVLSAVRSVEGEIAEAIIGMDAADQEAIDRRMIELDGTDNKSRLGANAILAVSLAVSRAAAASSGRPLYIYLGDLFGTTERMKLPVPLMNIANGGRHANWATDIQEYMVIPTGASSFADSLRAGAEIYAELRGLLKAEGRATGLGDEGGFVIESKSNADPFEFIARAIGKTSYALGGDVFFGIDAAASEFYDEGKYNLRRDGLSLSSGGLKEEYERLMKRYPIISIEDPFAEDDWNAFADFTASSGNKIQIVGDDLFVTSAERIKKGAEDKAANAALIKPNQIGTLTETVEAVKAAWTAGMATIISHRSGETEDSYIADLSVALGANQIKTGAPARGERTAKYNRLIAIEEESGLGLAKFTDGISR